MKKRIIFSKSIKIKAIKILGRETKMMAKLTVKDWDGESRLQNLTPELEELMKIGTQAYNTILDFWKKNWLLYYDYDYGEELTSKQEEVVNEAKKHSDLIPKFIEAFKAAISPEAYEALNEGHTSYQISKTHSIGSYITSLATVGTSNNYEKCADLANSVSSKMTEVAYDNGDFDSRRTIMKKGKLSDEIIKQINEYMKYFDILPIRIPMWAQYEQHSDVVNELSFLIPLIGIKPEIKYEVVSWVNHGMIDAIKWWDSEVSNEMIDDNLSILFSEHLGIFESTKQGITFEHFWNKYEPGTLIEVSNAKIAKVAKQIILTYEKNIKAKLYNKVGWDYSHIQLYRNIDVVKYAKKFFKPWVIKGGKLTHNFYSKGVQILR